MKTLILTISLLIGFTTSAFSAELVNVSGASGIAVQGYDPVAFFVDHKPTFGDPSISVEYKGATYLFASDKHKKMFEAKPHKYVPQFGGFCAYGAAVGALFPVETDTWQIHKGKLYLNLNPTILDVFNKDIDTNIAKAHKNWKELVRKNGK